MKSFNTVLNIVLLIAVAVLFYREFSPSTSSPSGNESEAIAEDTHEKLRVAYLNYDSLIANYEYHNELKSKLEKRAQKLEADLEQKSEVFQENVAILQERARDMNEEQLQQAQLELQQTQQQLMQYQEQKSQELAEEEKELTRLLREDLDSVLTEIRDEQNLHMIFSHDSRSDLLSVNRDYNITPSVTKRLNEKYQSAKSREKRTEEME